MSMSELAAWLQTPAGQYLLNWEKTTVDGLVGDIFGYRALQIGLPQVDLLAANRIAFRFSCDPADVGATVHANAFALPFDSASLDLVLLPHVLEFSPHPHDVLREVERVLVAEGNIILAGFNPLSLWGLRRALGKRAAPWTGHYRSAMRLRDWLALLGFGVRTAAYGCYAPPLGSHAWLQRMHWLDGLGARLAAPLGGSYVIHGIKRVQGMRLVTPKWREARRVAKPLTAVTRYHGSAGRTVK